MWLRKLLRVRDARTDDTEGRQARRAHRDDEQSSPPSGAAANGYRGGYVLKADEGDDVVVAVMYDDKDAYFAMVHDPKTDGSGTSGRSWRCSRASRRGPTASGSERGPDHRRSRRNLG
jgi:hypothetical protein